MFPVGVADAFDKEITTTQAPKSLQSPWRQSTRAALLLLHGSKRTRIKDERFNQIVVEIKRIQMDLSV